MEKRAEGVDKAVDAVLARPQSGTGNEEIQEVPLHMLRPFANHPFKVTDDDAMARLVDSIDKNGLGTPILVRLAQEGHGVHEIISGHRRVEAYRKLGKKKSPRLFAT